MCLCVHVGSHLAPDLIEEVRDQTAIEVIKELLFYLEEKLSLFLHRRKSDFLASLTKSSELLKLNGSRRKPLTVLLVNVYMRTGCRCNLVK